MCFDNVAELQFSLSAVLKSVHLKLTLHFTYLEIECFHFRWISPTPSGRIPGATRSHPSDETSEVTLRLISLVMSVMLASLNEEKN